MHLFNTSGRGSSRPIGPVRTTLGVVVALLLAVLAAGCGSSNSSGGTSGDTGSSKTFTFTDDRGKTVTLDTSKVRIVAQEDAAQALMHFGIKPVGIFGGAPMSKNAVLKGLDLSGIESLGEAWGEIKMEKLAALHPDVIVSTIYTGDGALFPGGVYGFGTEKQQNDAAEIAPIIAIKATQPSSTVISRFGDLAKALGADIDKGEYATQRADFDKAVTDLKAAAAKSKASVLAVTPANDADYIAVPDAFADTQDLVNWGVNMMKPTGKLVSSYYESLSWENAAKYQPDILLVDVRGYTLGEAQLESQYPTWNDIKAVKNGNLGEWTRISLNYPDYTTRIKQLTGLLQKASSS